MKAWDIYPKQSLKRRLNRVVHFKRGRCVYCFALHFSVCYFSSNDGSRFVLLHIYAGTRTRVHVTWRISGLRMSYENTSVTEC